MDKQGILKEKINSILDWSDDLHNEYYVYHMNGWGRDYDSIYSIVNTMLERAKEIKEILKDDEFNQ